MSPTQAKCLSFRSPSSIFFLTALISFTVVLGWRINAPSLVRLLPFLPPVRFNCAILQLLSAVSLLLYNFRRPRLALLSSGVLITFASLFLIQHLFKCDLGIDSLFAPSHLFAKDVNPGRISLFGSLGFLLVGLSSALLSLPKSRSWVEGVVALAAAMCVAMGLFAAIGLSLGLNDGGQWTRFHGITPQGAFFFTLIGIGLLWQSRNVFAGMRNEERVRKLAIELSRSNQEMEQFAAVASHDLQEPLRMISSYLSLLTQRYQQRLDQDARDFIYFAVDGTSRMKLLVEGLLSYSRVGCKNLNLKTVDLNSLASKVRWNLQDVIRENNATVTFENLPTIVADEIQLFQIFHNLILNGIKYRRAASPEIQVRCNQLSDKTVLSVSDNGIGISPSQQEKLFRLFHRLHYRDKDQGAGIGLATCKKIVERHGGEIWVESQLNRGTTFFFTVPRYLA